MESLLWLKVSKPMANAMLADKLQAEQLVRSWMKGWRTVSGQPVVTIYVEWMDVQIAKGDTTLLRGDQVTFR
jgi:hypothetical protein